jgi:hypothetical protein
MGSVNLVGDIFTNPQDQLHNFAAGHVKYGGLALNTGDPRGIEPCRRTV